MSDDTKAITWEKIWKECETHRQKFEASRTARNELKDIFKAHFAKLEANNKE